MGELYFQFEGICTNFKFFENPQLPVLHRVVLPAVANFTSVFGRHVDSHVASYAIGEENDLPLDGVVVTVDNAVGNGCTYDPSYDAVPRLGTLMRNARKELSGPSLPALLGMNRDLVAAYFDFNSASFSACSSATTDRGAAITRVRVETEGDPILTMRGFAKSLIGGGDVFSSQPLASPTTIYVSNESTEKTGGDNDFLLSYLLAATLPTDPELPASVRVSQCTVVHKVRTGGTFDIYCSNSNYP